MFGTVSSCYEPVTHTLPVVLLLLLLLLLLHVLPPVL
jgi:hypothetical protein